MISKKPPVMSGNTSQNYILNMQHIKGSRNQDVLGLIRAKTMSFANFTGQPQPHP